MSGSINRVILIGNLGRDPEVRTTQSGAKIVNMTVATSEKWKDKNSGEWREKTEWNNVVIWNEHLADVAERYLRKGSKVYLKGQLQTRKWQAKDGSDRYTTEIVLGRYKGELILLDPPQGQGQRSAPTGHTAGAQSPNDLGHPKLDDEIPF